MWNYSILLGLLLLAVLAAAQNRKCILQDDCEKCLLADPACAWCTDRNYNLKKPRCMTPDELIAASCDAQFVYQNNYVALEILENKDLRDYSITKGDGSSSGKTSSSTSGTSSSSGSSSSSSSSSSSGGNGLHSDAQVVQIQPQRVKLSIAKGSLELKFIEIPHHYVNTNAARFLSGRV